jgi:ATPase subunit of ABC transporter with duplicated ATPase domains
MGAPIAVNDLAYAHPGGEELFAGVSFKVPAGAHAGLVGANGVGKSTLLRVLAGELAAAQGAASLGGRALRMAQDVGAGGGTVRELLLAVAPARVRDAGRRVLAA